MLREREKEEEAEFRLISFNPDCKPKPSEKSVVAPFTADVADRNQKWMARREEKLNRLIAEQEKNVEASCSFKPYIVVVR